MNASLAAPIPYSVKEKLRAAGLSKVFVIDDLYQIPGKESVRGQVDEFLDDLIDAPALDEEVREVCGEFFSAEEFLDRCLDPLWLARDNGSSGFKNACKKLFSVFLGRRAALAVITEHLKYFFETVEVCLPDADIPSDARVVFLDYHLSEDLHEPWRRSVEIAQELSRRTSRPYLVLFSDQDSLPLRHVEFRRKCNYLGGNFAFIKKLDASVFDKLCLNFCSWGIGDPALEEIRRFLEAAIASLESAKSQFKETLSALGPQDFSFIQRLSLQGDGELLGEYMLDMLSTMLSYKLKAEKQMRVATDALNALQFERHLPSSTQPSAPLNEFLKCILTEPGISEELLPHPAFLSRPMPNGKLAPPLLHLGDIFHSDNGPLLMVINPACDLQYGPGRGIPDPQLPVYFIPAILQEPLQPLDKGNFRRTEWLEINEKTKRVVWDHEHVESVLRYQVFEWLRDRGYRRLTRLALPYALAIQGAWTSHLSRVGLPVNLPYFETADLDIFFLDSEDKWRPCDVSKSSVILSRHDTDSTTYEHFTLTTRAVDALHSSMHHVVEPFIQKVEEVKSEITTNRAEVSAGGPEKTYLKDKLKSAENNLQRLKDRQNDWAYWTDLMETSFEFQRNKPLATKRPFTVTIEGATITPVVFYFDKKLNGAKKEGVSGSAYLAANLRPQNV